MEYVILIALLLFGASSLIDWLKHYLKSEIVAIWVLSFVMLLIPGCSWIAVVILGWHYILTPMKRFEEKRNNGKSSIRYIIPIFWPSIIAQMMFSDDAAEPDITYCD